MLNLGCLGQVQRQRRIFLPIQNVEEIDEGELAESRDSDDTYTDDGDDID